MPRISPFVYHLMLGAMAALIAFPLIIQLAFAGCPGSYCYPPRQTKPPRQPVSQGIGVQPSRPIGTNQSYSGQGTVSSKQTRYPYSNVRSTHPVWGR